MKKVVVIDNLTETFNGPIVKSGLQKSSKLDARAFSISGFDTTFIYCGVLEDTYPYKHLSVNDIGAKDNANKENKHFRSSGVYVKSYLMNAKDVLEEADYIIAHCHSVGMMTGLDMMLKDKKILCIFHDIVDLMWSYGFSGAVSKIKKSDRNRIFIATNSQYSIDRLNYVYKRAIHKKDPKHELLSGDQAFNGFIKHFVWTDIKPTIEDIKNKENKSAIIGRYEPKKFHHKLYGYNNKNNIIVHYGIKDIRRDKNLKYYNTLKQKANSFKENLKDEELWNEVKRSQSIIIPCWHEGFGFTAFEAGIFGVVPIVLAKKQSYGMHPYQHATSEYLTRIGVKHFLADFNNKKEIFNAIDESLNVSFEERLEISSKLLNYFSLENYVAERINLMDSTQKNIIEACGLEKFFV